MKLIQLVETRRLVLASTLGPIVTKVLRQFTLFTTSSCYRSCQFGGCAPKTPGGARARFQVRWMGAAPPKTAQGQVALGQKLGAVSPCADIYFSLHLSILLSHLYWAQVQIAQCTRAVHGDCWLTSCVSMTFRLSSFSHPLSFFPTSDSLSHSLPMSCSSGT